MQFLGILSDAWGYKYIVDVHHKKRFLTGDMLLHYINYNQSYSTSAVCSKHGSML